MSKVVASTIGRRKRAVASVHLISGDPSVTVNGKPAPKFFTSHPAGMQILNRPFEMTDTVGKFGATIKVIGGGITGQVESASLGLARALAGLKEEYRKKLRDTGLLTRDSRKKQRRMVGTGGKARRQKQSPKR